MIIIKTYSLPKEDSPLTPSLDRISLNPCTGRYAVADGVTHSFLPEITAEIIADFFTNGQYDFDQWPDVVHDVLLPRLAWDWDTRAERFMNSIDDPIELFDLTEIRKQSAAGASTLAGIEVDTRTGRLGYHILGDSTLFVMPRSGGLIALSTSPKVERDGISLIDYSSVTMCIKGRGFRCDGPSEFLVSGDWLSGYIDIDEAYVALMTDGLAAWFQHQYYQCGTDAFLRLWNLQDRHRDFPALAAQARAYGWMNDDLSAVLFKIKCNKS